MNAPLVVAGCLATLAAAIHGAAGEILVVRRLSTERLAASPFGGPRMTKAMIHVTWHLTTVAFLAVGVGLLLSGAVIDGEAARGLALLGAAAASGFALVAVGLGAAYMRSPRFLYRHLGPLILSATAALAWWGALL